MTLEIAHFGFGYWGPNLVRNFQANHGCRVKWIVDADPANLEKASQRFPDTKATTNPKDALADTAVKAVTIATPAATHFELAKAALIAGKHVFIEKPLCATYAESKALVELADHLGLILFVGHVFIYNNAVTELKRLIDSGELGDLYCIHSQRLSLGRVRADVDVLWNLAPHDISILLYLLGETPNQVRGYGHSFLQTGINDIGFIDLTFPSGVAAHIHCSWLHPRKTREMIVVGSKKMVVYDDVSADAKLSIYDCGIDKKEIPRGLQPIESFAHFQLIQRAGNLVVPHLKFPEPLAVEARAFIDCVRSNTRPITDGQMGLEVVRILEQASPSPLA